MESKKIKQKFLLFRNGSGTTSTSSGDGWAANRPMGGQGRTPITGQKQLRGKIVNLITANSI